MKRILIVDDNLAILKQIAAFLEGEYEVSLAKSGALALQICARERPDLILLDIEMPDMDGFEVITRLKQNPRLSHIPVLFLTARGDIQTEVRALELEARDFITKPVEKSILLHRVKLHINFVSYQVETEEHVTELSDNIANAFAELIEYRDENTGGHVMRTARYFEIIGNDLIGKGLFSGELGYAELQLMVRAAALHDIGKIAISDRILLKSGRLDDTEFKVMKRHADIGAAILKRMHKRMPAQQYLRYACLIASSHHERFDGKGYPLALAGDEIPLCGRIMAVADVYDALMENRVYRRGLGHAQAYNIIVEGRGSQFDPRLVDSFISIQDTIRAVSASGSGGVPHD